MSRWESAPYAATALLVQSPLGGEPGEVELTDFAPGPAGTAGTRVHGDVTIDVDFAEPDRLCSLEAADIGSSRTLEQLIGPESYRAVRAALLRGGEQVHRITPTRSNSMNRGGMPTTSLPGPDARLRDFTFSLASRAVGDDPYESPLVRAVAYLESAALLVSTGWAGVVDGGGLEEQLVFASESLLQDAVDEQLIDELDLRDYERLREAVMQVAQHPAWAKQRWVQRLVRRFPRRLVDLDAERHQRLEEDMAMDVMPSLRSVAFAPPRAYEDARSIVTHEPPMRVERLGPGRYVYRYTTRPDGSWLRLVDASTQSLLALVPIKRHGRAWEAHVVLPLTTKPSSVVAEPTDRPTVGSASTVDAMILAIDLGRAAARLSAAGDRAAVGRWRLCAQAWTELGDDGRAGRALAYAEGVEQVTRPAFVHDKVRDLDGDR